MSAKKARYTIFHNNHLVLSTGKTERLNARHGFQLIIIPKYSTEKKYTHSDFSLGCVQFACGGSGGILPTSLSAV